MDKFIKLDLTTTQREQVTTFASLLVEMLLERNYVTEHSPKDLHHKLTQAVQDDISEQGSIALLREYGPRLPDGVQADLLSFHELVDDQLSHAIKCARQDWPRVWGAVLGLRTPMRLPGERQKIPTLRDAAFTVHQLEQAVRERSMAEHPPHWKVMFQRGLVRIESHHPCGTVLIRDGADLMEASRLMLETIDSLRTAGVLP